MNNFDINDSVEVTITISGKDFRDMMEHLSRSDRGRSYGKPLVAVEHLSAVNGDSDYDVHMFEKEN